jgi:hypothetical protein
MGGTFGEVGVILFFSGLFPNSEFDFEIANHAEIWQGSLHSGSGHRMAGSRQHKHRKNADTHPCAG